MRLPKNFFKSCFESRTHNYSLFFSFVYLTVDEFSHSKSIKLIWVHEKVFNLLTSILLTWLAFKTAFNVFRMTMVSGYVIMFLSWIFHSSYHVLKVNSCPYRLSLFIKRIFPLINWLCFLCPYWTLSLWSSIREHWLPWSFQWFFLCSKPFHIFQLWITSTFTFTFKYIFVWFKVFRSQT